MLGYVYLLSIVLVVLRAFEVILWPWVAILSPFWVPFALIAILSVISFTHSTYAGWRAKRLRKKQLRKYDKYKEGFEEWRKGG